MALKRRIKVLVIDDSLLFRETLARGLSKDPDIEVVGTASDPFVARDLILEKEPDVLTLDVEMPRMNGIEFLRRLMPQYPLPVIVVSAISSNVFDALNAGAVDFITKPNYTKADGLESFINEMIIKIKVASIAKVGNKHSCDRMKTTDISSSATSRFDIIAIGASTGGTEAIYTVLKALPREIPGIVITQHMPPVFTKMYAERLNNSCSMEVREAQNGDIIAPGRVLIAPGDYHMKVKKSDGGLYVVCERGEKVNGHCPSVDVLFNSIVDLKDISAIGVILTGMGYDGAKGLLNMKKSGAFTIGQDQETSVVYGMPKVAYDLGAVKVQESIDNIPEVILSILKNKTN